MTPDPFVVAAVALEELGASAAEINAMGACFEFFGYPDNLEAALVEYRREALAAE